MAVKKFIVGGIVLMLVTLPPAPQVELAFPISHSGKKSSSSTCSAVQGQVSGKVARGKPASAVVSSRIRSQSSAMRSGI